MTHKALQVNSLEAAKYTPYAVIINKRTAVKGKEFKYQIALAFSVGIIRVPRKNVFAYSAVIVAQLS